VPYQPDAGTACGRNFINSNDSFGHGYFDGFSVVGGHEYAEAITDPFPNSGWVDSSGAENGDKCAWAGSSGDVGLGSYSFAVQPLWSNLAGGCVLTSGTSGGGTATTHGYEILTTGGGIYSFGSAQGHYYGNLIDHHYPGPAAAIAMTPSGNGYAILTSSGAIYTFGDAKYFGNLIDHGYPGPAVSMSYAPDGLGYSILTAVGAIYSFGDARYYGNLIDHHYPGPATSVAITGSGNGYSLLTGFGGIYSFGDAQYFGNLIDHGYPGPGVALANTP
jgi:hypothetical protein